MNLNKKDLQRGQAMIVATIFFLVISIVMIFGLIGPIVREERAAHELVLSRQSYFLAESGVEDVLYRLKSGYSVGSSETLTLASSTATTQITDSGSDKQIVSTGDFDDSTRKVEADVTLGTGASFHYGIQVGAGGFTLSNNSGVIGNVYSNASISGQNGSYITGDAFAAGSITGVNVSGQKKTGQDAQGFPITDQQITDWKSAAAAGGTFTGTKSISGSSTLGPMKINGDLKISNGAHLTVTGTLWVTGNLSLSNNSDVSLDSSYGSSDGMIIVDGTSVLSNGSSFAGSGNSGSYIMLLSTNSTGNAITLQNNAGAVILYAPNGTVELSNGAGVEQITARTISLQNNATIQYNSGLINTGFTSGPGATYNVQSWKEVQ